MHCRCAKPFAPQNLEQLGVDAWFAQSIGCSAYQNILAELINSDEKSVLECRVTPTYLTGVGVNLNTFVFLLFNLPNEIQILGFTKNRKIAYQ
jgi:hypothetical protein